MNQIAAEPAKKSPENHQSITPDMLEGKTVYLPQMSVEGSGLIAASLRSIGIDGRVYPDSDSRTVELGGKYTSGDECYPLIITLGNFLKLLEDESVDPDKTAFLFASSEGPCRFGQYLPFITKVIRDLGYHQIPVLALHGDSMYSELGDRSLSYQRTAWRGIICGDILRKFLLKTRPYELHPGETDRVHQECLNYLCEVVEIPGRSKKKQLEDMLDGLRTVRDKFNSVETEFVRGRPLIGVVGEIFCRLENFSNSNLIRSIEKNGGEAWLANIGEWVLYVNFIQKHFLRQRGKRISKSMLEAKIRNSVQLRDEEKLYEPFEEDFRGYEEASRIETILSNAADYLPYQGALGEMTLSTGTSLYFYEKGADGIIDISPFTCMNGIVTEAIYPKVSEDHENFPMRVFYFDGTETDLDRDVGIFLDLARTYQSRKTQKRIYPDYFQ